MRRIACALALLMAVSCGDDGPTSATPAVPDIAGVYQSPTFWQIRATRSFDGATFTETCPGTLTVTQTRSNFSGSFTMSGGCGTLTGSVSNGVIRSDGGLAFAIDAPGTNPGLLTSTTGCAVTSASSGFNGLVTGRTIDASATISLRCPIDGNVVVQYRIVGGR